MANSNVLQSKNKRLVFEPETTFGTFATLGVNSFLVPAEEIAMDLSARGTKMISRSGINDGYAGGVRMAPGSFGGSLSFKTEIFDIKGENIDTYLGLLLAACGHQRKETSAGSNIWEFEPSQAAIANYSAETASPIGLSFGLLQDAGAGSTNDFAQYMTGSVGKAQFEFNAGERAMLKLDFVGKTGKMIVNGTSAYAVGTFPSGSATPLVVKDITATFVDSSSAPIDTIALSSFTLDSGATTPDVLDPTQENGFGNSPVLFDDAPTVNFSLGATNANNLIFLQSFKSGNPITISITLDGLAGRSYKLDIPLAQFEDVQFEDSDGYLTYTVVAKAVRNLNSASIYTFTITQNNS